MWDENELDVSASKNEPDGQQQADQQDEEGLPSDGMGYERITATKFVPVQGQRGRRNEPDGYEKISSTRVVPAQSAYERKDVLSENVGYEMLSSTQVIPVRAVEKVAFDQTKVTVQGYAYFAGMLETDPHKIEHTLLVVEKVPAVPQNDIPGAEGFKTKIAMQDDQDGYFEYKPLFEMPVFDLGEDEDVPSIDFTDKVDAENDIDNNKQLSENYHYRAEVDFSKINEGLPIVDGDYELFIRLKQYIDGKWYAHEFSVGKIITSETDTVYTTKMRWFAEKAVTTYSLVIKQDLGDSRIAVHSEKLATVNPETLIVQDDMPEPESKFVRKFKKSIFQLTYKMFKLLPIKKNRVSYLSDSRIDLTGNFEYIHNEMKRQNAPFDERFYFKFTNKEPKTIFEYITLAKAIATSRYVLLDDFYPIIYPLDIRAGVDLIQVWHAVGAFKTFGFSRVGMHGGPKITSRNHRNYTRALVSSHNVQKNYAEGFGIDEQRVIPLGAPRTDLFFNEKQKDDTIENLYEEMPFLKGKKVILFAPTFRGPGQQTAYYPFDWIDYEALYNQFADENFVFLFKIHPFVNNSPEIPYEYSDFFYDVSDYREVNDLLLISDVMITDYSSVVFEYSLLKRKTIFFAPDLGDYMASRNFYVNYLKFIPGPCVVDMEHLIEEIRSYQEVDVDRLDAFLEYYYDDLDGKASERFVNYLVENVDVPDLPEEEEHFTEDGKWIPQWGEDNN